MIDPARLEHLRGLEPFLRIHLRGQDHVLQRAAGIFVRGELGLARQDRPRGSFLAAGPTGTGKTELVLLCARYLFGTDNVRRFDLSEFQRADAVERLLGADASDGGAIGRAAQLPGRRVWLFDELEKAHPKVLDLFIQMLEPGHITLASGETISLCSDYVAFTSNLGAIESMRMVSSSLASIEQAVLRRAAESLRPELLARIPDKLVFARLAPDVQREIAGLHLTHEIARLKSAGFDLQVSKEALEFLIREGFHPQLGARPLRQTIERHLQDAVVGGLMNSGIGGGRIKFDTKLNGLKLET